MPKLPESTVPSYRLHKQSGQAIVTLNGRDILLGPHNTAPSKSEYRRRIAEWIASGRQYSRESANLTITELIAAFRKHAESYYRDANGNPAGEVNNFRAALRPLRALYGAVCARDFGPLALEAVRNEMIHLGWCRRSINNHVGRIKHIFKWAASKELIPASVHHGLATLAGLRAGRTDAVESEPVKPVADEIVDATLPFLSPTVRAMVKLQRLTGARPGEICSMRVGDIDRSGKVWVYRPAHHKTAHHGHRRTIYIGPKAQEALTPFLLKIDATAYVFSPAEAEADRRAAVHENRKTPLSCGNRPGSNRRRKPKRVPGDCYDVASYRRAIERATEAAFPPADRLGRQKAKGRKGSRWETKAEWQNRLGPAGWKELKAWRREHSWHPHQLRHTAATEIRKQFGIEAAQHVLGHATLSITELYAEKNADVARQIAVAIG